jgi:hypothetical protein
MKQVKRKNMMELNLMKMRYDNLLRIISKQANHDAKHILDTNPISVF